MATKAAPKKADPLDALAADPSRVLMLALWQQRHRNPDLFVQINEEDLAGFQACVDYLKVKPALKIIRPQGVAAQAAVQKGSKNYAAREAIPPRPYVIAAVVDAKTGDAIRPIESNEDDFDRQKETAAVHRARDMAPILAQRLIQQGNTGDTSLADMTDAANALMVMAKALQQ